MNASSGGATYQALAVQREMSVRWSRGPSRPTIRSSIVATRADVGAEGQEHQPVLQDATEGGRAAEHLELLAVVVLDDDPADVRGR